MKNNSIQGVGREIFAVSATCPHLRRSSFNILENSSEVVPDACTDMMFMAWMTSACLNTLLTSVSRNLTMLAGVPVGAKRAVQTLNSTPDMPTSAMVGMFGKLGNRVGAVTAKALTLPVCSAGNAGPGSEKVISKSPDIMALMDSVVLLN